MGEVCLYNLQEDIFMSKKNITIERLKDPKIFRKFLRAVQRKIKPKTLKEKKLIGEWNDMGEELAWWQVRHGRYEKALVIYKSIPWRRYSENKYVGMAIALMGLRLYREAKRLLEKGLKRFPESSRLLLGMGNFYYDIKDYSSSLKYFDLSLKYSPNCEDTLFGKGCALFGIGYYEEASLMFRQILEGWSDYPGSLIMMGKYYLLTGYPEEASFYFKRSLGIWSCSAEAYVGLFSSYLEMNLYTDALQIARECFREYHDHPDSYFILAEAYWIKGWENEAKDVLTEGIKRFPDDERLKELLKEIEDENDNPDDGKKLPLLPVLLCLQILRRKLERRT